MGVVNWHEPHIIGGLFSPPHRDTHCKYLRPHYDGIAAIHRTGTMIACRFLLQCIIVILIMKNEGQNATFK